jgi:lysozyme family protein
MLGLVGVKLILIEKAAMATAIPKTSKYSVLKPFYEAQFAAVQIEPKWVAEATRTANAIAKNKARYDPIAAKFGMPWVVIGIIHHLEGGGQFSTHFHNGDKLTSRTVTVPAGQPETGSPPFTFEVSAEDALKTKFKTSWAALPATEWGIAAVLWRLVAYNGFGYEPNGRENPYLWSGCQFYKIGKYQPDGKYQPGLVSQQPGAAIILKKAMELGFVDAKTLGTGTGIANVSGANGCIDGGAGGGRTMSMQNPQSMFEAMQVAFGLDGRARAQDKNVELRLNGAADPAILKLDPQKTFEIGGVQKEFVATYTVDEVTFTCGGGGLDVKVVAYAPDPNVPSAKIFTNGGGVAATPGGAAAPAGSFNERIFKAAESSRGASSRTGPDGGRNACAWAVNRVVLKAAGIDGIGTNLDLVDSVEEALKGGRGQLIEPRTSAQPGDIVIMGRGQKAHIGIYMGNGKTLSNGSSRAAFVWEDTWEAFDRRYGPPACRPYRVLK